jgi:UDP-2-acetamido-2-deoxy-ribo-hexuluronate aminotransferase
MNIPFVDLKAQQALLRSEIDRRIKGVLDHGRYILGPEVQELEEQLAKFSGASHVIGVSNGTDALLIALLAKNIGPGKAVFLPSFTYTATAEVVVLLGATPVFVDVDEATFNIAASDLEYRIDLAKSAGLTPAAVIPVDLFGLPADHNAVNEIAKHHKMVTIGDAAQSMGGRYMERSVGTLSDVTCTSFFPAKPLGCYGDGGAVFTDDEELAVIMRSLRAHGTGSMKYDVVRIGLNARLDTLQAAILLAKLTVFSDELKKRNELAAYYNNALADRIVTPNTPEKMYAAWAQYTIQLDRRDVIAEVLKNDNIPTAIYYPLPMHLQPAFSEFGSGKGSLPISERLCGRVLSLPMHPYMSEEVSEFICNKLVAAIET